MARDRNTPQKLVWRAGIVLLAGEGKRALEVADEVGVSALTVRRWRRRSQDKGIDGLLKDATRPSRIKPLSAERIARIVDLTLHSTPPGATHWSLRKMAKASGVSPSAAQRIWQAHGLKPHLTKSFKLARDPHFNDKVADIVGLYLDPPDKALVLCADEKSQIQALDRTPPGLPMTKGRAGTMTHDDKRPGVTTLFAALDVKSGRVIGTCMNRHRHQEFIRFPRTIDSNTPKSLDLHIIVDNCATHKHPKVKAWLARHKRFCLHFTPTSASWTNQVERFFGLIADEAIRRGAPQSAADLEAAIARDLKQHNEDPTPFIWAAKTGGILRKGARAKQVLESQH